MNPIEENNNQYEKKHINELLAIGLIFEGLFFKTINKIMFRTLVLKPNENEFIDLEKNPVFMKFLSSCTDELFKNIEISTVHAVRREWDLSNDKNDKWIKKYMQGKKVPEKVQEKLFKTNIAALNAFVNRKENGLNLSKNIWKYKPQFLQEIESCIQLGIAEGTPAAKMATEMKQYLQDPDRLFRRVKDKYGNLQLSKAAKAYHPGQGKYRSSYKNALRVARNEINMAYRTADYERWKDLDFIGGIEVKLSGRHPRPDICDYAQGKYPKEFKFNGWHTQCLCMAVPILPGEDSFDSYIDSILDGKTPKVTGVIKDVPEGLKNWIEENKDRIPTWKNTPYFIKDNFQETKDGYSLNLGIRNTSIKKEPEV